METGLVLQVLSTFNATPLEKTLRDAVVKEGLANSVGFTEHTQMSEYMLAPSSETERVIGSVILVRVEDWLRTEYLSKPESVTATSARPELQKTLLEFLNELAILSYRGQPVWVLPCPSNGWLSEQSKLKPLFQTFTNLLTARIRSISQVTVLNWPAPLSSTSFDDRHGDQSASIPLTQEGFDRLGEFLAGQVFRTLKQSSSKATPKSANRPPELASYLAGLQVKVELTPAGDAAKSHVDRILRTAASFSLAGENPTLQDSEVDALVQQKGCLLVSVTDRLADHGPSGVVICRWGEQRLIIESLSLSCPVLGKQVEYAVVTALAQIAAERQCQKIIFEYRPSGRNHPVLSFLQTIADQESEIRYVLPLDQVDRRIKSAAPNAGAWQVAYQKPENAISAN